MIRIISFATCVILVLLLTVLVGCQRPIGIGPPSPINPIEYSPPEGSDLYEPINGCPVVYYPFVEEVLLPETIREGEPFQIAVKVSAEFRPVVLLGCRWQWTGVFMWIDPDPTDNEDRQLRKGQFPIHGPPDEVVEGYGLVLDLPSVVENPPGIGMKRDVFIHNVPGLPAGRHLIQYQNVKERRLGGIGYRMKGPPSPYGGGDPEILQDPFVMVALPFTVLPTEGGGEQE
ncbi:hypothetical protein J7J84_02910 [bacterium]|nr:hypothetical protein [bacterium]